MNHPFFQLLVRWSVLALGVTIATKLVPGIECEEIDTLIVVVLLLSLFNAILRPLLVLFTLPFILVTMGLGIILINAFLFMLVSRLVEDFYVSSFWSALGGSLIVSATTIVLSSLMGTRKRRGPPRPPPGGGAKRNDVIDI